ncbi:NADH pyrophosphatase [uncultured archaeon]|nr:NADH pyrophosphatase [uncultured archaeon]
MVKLLTLVLIVEGDKVLLAMKKEGFGKGKWNGLGGKVKPEETIEQAAKREAREEACVRIMEMKKLGIVQFRFRGSRTVREMHIFKATKYSGKPGETKEMRPKWFNLNKIPFGKMWPADRNWMRMFLLGKQFRGRVLYGEKYGTVKKHSVISNEVVEARIRNQIKMVATKHTRPALKPLTQRIPSARGCGYAPRPLRRRGA